MDGYESPALHRVGSVAELTQGHIFQQGHDSMSWIPIFGGPRDGGGFGS